MLQQAVASNKAVILQEFNHLHCRQMELLAQLETDFITAMPQQFLEMTVGEFLNNHHGDFNVAYSSLMKREDHNNINNKHNISSTLSQTSSQASTTVMNQQNPKGILPTSYVVSTYCSKSILKNSKRKRNNDCELKIAIQSCHSYNNNRNQGIYHINNNLTRDDLNNNKENYEYISNHSNMINSQQLVLHKNTAKKAYEQQSTQQQDLRLLQSGHKSSKKIWRI